MAMFAKGIGLAALSLTLGVLAVSNGADAESGALPSSVEHAAAATAVTETRPVVQPQIQDLIIVVKPDLVIGEVQAVPGDDRKLSVRLVNQGTAGAGPTNMKVFYHRSGKVMVRGTFVQAIPAGGNLWVVADIGSPIAYASAVQLRVDDPNRIGELSEGNNGYIWK